jgi:hypothetical protein
MSLVTGRERDQSAPPGGYNGERKLAAIEDLPQNRANLARYRLGIPAGAD